MFLQSGPRARNPIGGTPIQLDLLQLNWRIVNDGVMGGRSKSRLDIHDNGLVFSGELSIENRGGFVSVLGKLTEPLENPAEFKLSVSGDNRRYQLRLRESESASDVAWRAFFNTRTTESTLQLQSDEFRPVMRGQLVNGARPLSMTPIRYVGFMLTSHRPGPFELNIHSLEVWPGNTEATESGTHR